MRKIFSALIILACFTTSTFGYNSSELKRMSVFISNFTETGLNNIDIDNISDSELADFGIWHNWHNNFKTRIKHCPAKNCPYGTFIIDKKFVAESVKKYFDLEIEHQNTSESYGHYDGKFYHFEGASGESVQARVFEAHKRGGIIIMSGETYYPDNEEIKGESFTAKTKPYKYNGKDTWKIISLKVYD